jgi:23S rRNA-/tRNA-specific pseudouridylate synthase
VANLFGSEKPVKTYSALVQRSPEEESFEVDAKLAPHPVKLGLIRVDEKNGKRSRTQFELVEKFAGYSLLKCRPLTGRQHQIRVHLQYAGLPIVGDSLYGGHPLMLSSLKRDYRLKPNKTERPLLDRVSLHAEELSLVHPLTNAEIKIVAPWPKDLKVAVKYLRLYAATAF